MGKVKHTFKYGVRKECVVAGRLQKKGMQHHCQKLVEALLTLKPEGQNAGTYK